MKVILKRVFIIMLIIIMLLIICISIVGCPDVIPITEKNLRKAEHYIEGVILELNATYEFNLKKDNRKIEFEYLNERGEPIKCSFRLDAYDRGRNFGFVFVSLALKEEIEKNNAANSPSFDEIDLIIDAALNYEFPVLFIYVPECMDTSKIVERKIYIKEVLRFFETDIMKSKLKDWRYDGKSIRNYFDWYISPSTSMKNKNVPEKTVKYINSKGDECLAVFVPDAYSKKFDAGFKFVTEIDIEEWNTKRANGDTTCPDMNEYQKIFESALNDKNYPVLFVYTEKYWEKDFYQIFEELDSKHESLLDYANKLFPNKQ